MSEIMTVICALLGVVGLIFLTYYATRWLNKKFRYGGLNGNGAAIKIVECIGIAQDKQLMVVSVGKKNMLIGVTPTSISRIADLDSEDMKEFEKPAENGTESFAESLRRAFTKKGSDAGAAEISDLTREENSGRDENNDF